MNVKAGPGRRSRRAAGAPLDAAGEATVALQQLGYKPVEVSRLVQKVAGGELSKSEALGHQEFILTYKQFEPIGPACLPAA